MDNTIFIQTLNSVASLVSTLESYQDLSGVNISNWIVQLIGNSTIEYELSLSVTLKDNKPVKVKIPTGFMPATTKRDSQSYIGLIRSGKLDKPDVEVYCLIGYFLSSMVLGKIPSIVNSGRGLIVERMFKDLNIVDCNLTIKSYSSGGKDKPHELEWNYPELRALMKLFATRAQRILALEKRSGKTDKLTAIGKRNVEFIE